MKYSSIARRVLKEGIEVDFTDTEVSFELDGVKRVLPKGEFTKALSKVDKKEQEKAKREQLKVQIKEARRQEEQWKKIVGKLDGYTKEEAIDALAEVLCRKLIIQNTSIQTRKTLEEMETENNKESIKMAFSKFMKEEPISPKFSLDIIPEDKEKFKVALEEKYGKDSPKTLVKSIIKLELENREMIHYVNVLKKIVDTFQN